MNRQNTPEPTAVRQLAALLLCVARLPVTDGAPRTGAVAEPYPAKQLIDARVGLEAKRPLAQTGLPLAALSRRLGFSEPSDFGKFFTRATDRRETQGDGS